MFHAPPEKYNAYNAKPFVGYISSDESVEIIEKDGGLICRQSRSATLTMALIAFIALLSLGFSFASPDFAKMIRDFQTADLLGKVGLSALCLFVFGMLAVMAVLPLKYLLNNTRMILSPCGTLHFYQNGDPEPERSVLPTEMESLRLETVSFQGKRRTYVNTLLILTLKTGEETVLFASLKPELMSAIHQDFSQRLGLELPTSSV